MNYFSKRSKKNLETCNFDLKIILYRAIKEIDFAVICGHRGEREQNIAYENGFSKVLFPDSEHNEMPSNAVDIAPYPIDWNDINRFNKLAKVIKRIAKQTNIKIKWGGDWKNFKDYPHFELEITDRG